VDGIMSSKLFATRQGTIFLGVIAAVIAAVALIVYLNQYRNSVNNNALTPVLIAKHSLQAGTPGDVLISNGSYYRVSHVAKSSLAKGALVDPSALGGEVLTTDVGQGQQLTAADFSPATNGLTEQLNPTQRAVVIPLGTPQQVGAQIGGGSHVDVYVSVTVAGKQTVELLLPDMYILAANGGNVTFRATPQQAAQLIYASENASLWLDLRPTIAKDSKQPPVTRIKAGG